MRDGEDRMVLHVVQDLATPHNNSLIGALRARGWGPVRTWYAVRTAKELPWKHALGGEADNTYCDGWRARWALARRFLGHPEEHFLVVGYANPCTGFLVAASWLLRRPIMVWMDNPATKPRSRTRRLLNRAAMGMLRSVGRPTFVVGERTVERFVHELGFRAKRVVNLPIFISVPPSAGRDPVAAAAVRARYEVSAARTFFVAASRLTHEKGYDLLLQAVHRLGSEYRQRISVLIVGTGPEEPSLRAQARQFGLEGVVRFEGWLEPGQYEEVLSAADVFIHPARFDAFGGGTLYAMALGIPVIGSDGAGAVVERVRDGVNGLVFAAGDVDQLARGMRRLADDPAERERLGQGARRTAEEWRSDRGAGIVETAMRGRASFR